MRRLGCRRRASAAARTWSPPRASRSRLQLRRRWLPATWLSCWTRGLRSSWQLQRTGCRTWRACTRCWGAWARTTRCAQRSPGACMPLRRMHACAMRCDAHACILRALARADAYRAVNRAPKNSYVKATGSRLVTDASKDGEMVPSLLELKASLDGVQRDAFGGNESFSHALKDAFETFINARANRPAELVAKYIDGALRAVRALVSSAYPHHHASFSHSWLPPRPSAGQQGHQRGGAGDAAGARAHPVPLHQRQGCV